MMMTIKRKGRSSGIGSMFKSLCLGMLLVAGLGFLNSTQAQTALFLGGDVAKQITIEFDNEEDFLEREINSPNSTKEIKAWNHYVINSYERINKQFSNGGNLQKLMLSMLRGAANSSGLGTSPVTRMNLPPSQQQGLDSIIQFVETWNVTSRDHSDFGEALILIRELKNQ